MSSLAFFFEMSSLARLLIVFDAAFVGPVCGGGAAASDTDGIFRAPQKDTGSEAAAESKPQALFHLTFVLCC